VVSVLFEWVAGIASVVGGALTGQVLARRGRERRFERRYRQEVERQITADTRRETWWTAEAVDPAFWEMLAAGYAVPMPMPGTSPDDPTKDTTEGPVLND
jgi:hypothetical protein